VEIAESNVRAALVAIGLEAVIQRELVATVEDAERLGFAGSPMILIDGTDPFATPGAQPGIACRLYEDGKGAPDVRHITEALAGWK
jgi:hypothetical protein